MRHPSLLLLPAFAFIACGNTNAPVDSDGDGTISGAEVHTAAQKPTKKFVEGQDYMVFQRLRVIDPTGFAQPMEAYSILIPKGWKSQGGITWRVGDPCMAEAIQNRMTATSPDGKFELNFYPQQEWDWWDDEMMLQTQMQQAQNPVFRRCTIAQPMDAGQFMQGPMAQEMGAQVTKVEPSEELNNALRQQAQATNKQYQQAGVNLESRPSAVIGTLRYPDGSAGVALCSIAMQVAYMPNYMTGGQSASYTCQAVQKIALKCPAGKEEEARKLLSMVMSSVRINPEWQAGVQRMLNNVAAVEQHETAKRQQIWHEAQNDIAQSQQRSWEAQQESQDRVAESWGQSLRGVETWSDPGGGKVELSAGYNEAWSRPDGTYILSNDPLFDPSVVLKEDWKRLEKK